MRLPRITSITCGALLVFLFGLPAQADNEEAIARCARIATVGDRILCLENALRQSSLESAETPAAEVAPVHETPVATIEAAGETPAVDIGTTIDAAAVQTPPADENFGMKEKRPPKDTSPVQVTVTAVRKSLTNRFVFETASGQIWLQTDQRSVRYSDTPFDAEIRPASMGSFFLKAVAGGPSVRVRRER